MSFADIAYLFTSGGDDPVIEASENWELEWDDIPSDAPIVIWGRGPARSGLAPAHLMAHGARRAASVVNLRRPRGARGRRVTLHRWDPPVLQPGLANIPRSALRAGLVAELRRPDAPPSLAARAASDARARLSGLRFGSGGAILAMDATERGVLRIARREGPAGSAAGNDALRALEEAGVPRVPRLLREGAAEDASWSLETRLPGSRPPSATPELARAVADFTASLPTTRGPSRSIDEDVVALTAIAPEHAAVLKAARKRAARAIRGLPAVTVHGDLWLGNVLVERGALTGVVDWDAWRPAGVPGTDLLHFVANDIARRAGSSAGETWLRRPWRSQEFESAAAAYWARLRIEPTSAVLDAVGLAWWASLVASTLRRLPHLAEDETWMRANVRVVAERLAQEA